MGLQVQKAVEQRERDIAKWATKTEGGADDDSLDTTTKPRKVKTIARVDTSSALVSDENAVPRTQRFSSQRMTGRSNSGDKSGRQSKYTSKCFWEEKGTNAMLHATLI